MNRLRKHYSHHVGMVAWALNRCLPTKKTDYCMLVNEWAGLRSYGC